MMPMMGGPGMQPPPQPLNPDQQEMLGKPSWEQVFSVLKDNAHRNFRIGIETDSLVAGSLESDMTGLKDVLGAVTQFISSIEPVVQSGMLPLDAVKEIVMTITRRARMGMAVEDALDKMQQPPPPTDPNAGKIQAAQQQAQMKAQFDMQKMQAETQNDQMQMQMKAQLDQQVAQSRQQQAQQQAQVAFQLDQQRANLSAQVEAHKQQMQQQQIQAQNQIEGQRQQMEAQANMRMEQMRLMMEAKMETQQQQFDLLIARLGFANKIEVAEVTKSSQLELAQMAAANEASQNDTTRGMPNNAPQGPTQ